MPTPMESVFRALLEFIGVSGLLAGGIGGIIVLSLYFIVKDRINPYQKAKAYAERGHLHRAFALLAIELHRNPSNRRALLMRADIERDRGLYAEAEGDYYALIDLKKSGDGIDVLEVKKRLISVLYRQGKLYETFKMIKEVLAEEKTAAEALYHLGLIYLGQLYYKEAWRILERLLQIRPRAPSALFAASVALIQLKDYEKALELIRKAMDIEKDPVYTLACACAHFLMENYAEAERELNIIPRGERVFDSPKQVHFYQRLSAFSALKLNSVDAADRFAGLVKSVARETAQRKRERKTPPTTPKKSLGVYNQFGKLQNVSKGRDGEREPKDSDASSDVARSFFKMKEVLKEEGRWQGGGGLGSSAMERFLDLEGLSGPTWALVDLGFTLVKTGRLADARKLFEEMPLEHPEVLGIQKLVELIREKERGQTGGSAQGQRGAHPSEEKHIQARVHEGTSRVIAKKKRRYELWEYIEQWEENGIRPYHLMIACDLASRKQLNPQLLLTKGGQYTLDIY